MSYAMTAHGKQFRASGDPYFAHPLEVAAILTDLKLDVPTIVTALLHDTIEDTLVTYDDLRDKFGEEIANLVDGVTKLFATGSVFPNAPAGGEFRKLMLASPAISACCCKAGRPAAQHADPGLYRQTRINASASRKRRWTSMPRWRGASACRTCAKSWKPGLRRTGPEARNSIVTHFARLDMVGGDRVGRIADQIKRRLAEHGMEAWVYGRGKRPFSIWRKLQTKKLSFETTVRHFGFRVIVGSAADCYAALGIIHTSWQMVPERFKDFISTPSPMAIAAFTHGDWAGKAARRNPDPHPGDARHRRTRCRRPLALSRACAGSRQEDSVTYGWLRDMVDLLERGDSAEEVLEHSRLAMYQDQVFCFTPKGSLISCARGDRRSISPMRCIPTWATARWVPRSTATMPAAYPLKNATRWKSSPPRIPRHRRVGTVRGHRAGAGRIRRFLRHAQPRRHVRSARQDSEKAFADEARTDGKSR